MHFCERRCFRCRRRMVKAPQVGQKVLVVVRVEEKEQRQVRVLVLAREERKVPANKVVHPARFQ